MGDEVDLAWEHVDRFYRGAGATPLRSSHHTGTYRAKTRQDSDRITVESPSVTRDLVQLSAT